MVAQIAMTAQSQSLSCSLWWMVIKVAVHLIHGCWFKGLSSHHIWHYQDMSHHMMYPQFERPIKTRCTLFATKQNTCLGEWCLAGLSITDPTCTRFKIQGSGWPLSFSCRVDMSDLIDRWLRFPLELIIAFCPTNQIESDQLNCN